MEIHRTYRYRCYPTEAQKRQLAQTFGCARYVHNWALEMRSNSLSTPGRHTSGCIADRRPVGARAYPHCGNTLRTSGQVHRAVGEPTLGRSDAAGAARERL